MFSYVPAIYFFICTEEFPATKIKINLMFLTVQNVQNSETKHSTPTFEPGT